MYLKLVGKSEILIIEGIGDADSLTEIVGLGVALALGVGVIVGAGLGDTLLVGVGDGLGKLSIVFFITTSFFQIRLLPDLMQV